MVKMQIFKKHKQYSWKIPYVTYWGCDSYHWIRFHTISWIGWIGNRINGNTLFTILYDKGKFSISKD